MDYFCGLFYRKDDHSRGISIADPACSLPSARYLNKVEMTPAVNFS
ncbi:hypothetical protein C942_04245 [Photobacterium marinum]|uniref:Uncharacterized protein n=1 Tax=Photobacterium marinum TaxID=1056511 RepID=L8JGJ3_9GAMM|nr:hypothetical protein C942_04245 [Photobacterium marinum]